MSILEQKLAKITSENPFYKMVQTFAAFNMLPKLAETVSPSEVYRYLDAAWAESKDDKQKRELFFSLVFSVGDVSNREHNIFRKRRMKDVDGGGHSKRRVFAFCLKWMLEKVPTQFYTFLPIIGEYYNLGSSFMYELVTDRWKGTLKEVIKLDVDINLVTNFIALQLQKEGLSDNDKQLWARWLPHIPSNKRIRKYLITEKNIKAFAKKHPDVKIGDTVKEVKNKQGATLEKDKWTLQFIAALSDKMDWTVVTHHNNKEFKGYKEFRTKHLANTEAVMFSTKSISNLDRVQLIDWFDGLPNGARNRVVRRVIAKDKTTGVLTPRSTWQLNSGELIGKVYLDWLELKKKAQETVRNLTTEEKAEMAPKELRKLEKAAKVNTGAESMLDILVSMFSGKLTLNELNGAAQTILTKMKMEVPVLVLADISGSMSHNSITIKGTRMLASQMAQLMTTIFLLKNPDEELGNMFIRFDDKAEMITSDLPNQVEVKASNKFLQGKSTKVSVLTDRRKTFFENYESVKKFIISRNGTHLTSIPRMFKEWINDGPVEMKAQKIEMINKYPVFLLISDGDLNNGPSAKASMLEFQRDMMHLAGWQGVVVLWDINEQSRSSAFSGMENVIHLSGLNPSVASSLFVNITDIDIVDTYIPLKTLANSSRYAPVRELVL